MHYPNGLVEVRSDKDLHFTGSLATNAAEAEDIVLPPACGGSAARAVVRAVTIQAKEDLDWELWFWASASYTNADMDLDYFLGKVVFSAAEGTQIGATGFFTCYKGNLDVPIVDRDNTQTIHVKLVNRNAASKTAGTNGQVVVSLWLEPI
jgi:hypothetical protein